MTIDIKEVQSLLNALGYDCGAVDGIWGSKSQSAMDAALKDYHIEQKSSFDQLIESTIKDDFWADIKHFDRSEFRCPCGKCGGFPVEPDERIVRAAEAIRVKVGKPMIIVPPDGHSGGSGVRCAAYNATLSGSVANSKHIEGKAIDFSVPGMSATQLLIICNQMIASGELAYAYKITESSVHCNV